MFIREGRGKGMKLKTGSPVEVCDRWFRWPARSTGPPAISTDNSVVPVQRREDPRQSPSPAAPRPRPRPRPRPPALPSPR